MDSIKAFLSDVKEALPGRWFWLLFGLGLIANGVFLIHQSGDINEANETLVRWNEIFHLEIVNILHLAVGTPYLLLGGLLSALAFTPPWKNGEEAQQIPARSNESPNWAYFLPRVAVTTLLFVLLIFLLAQRKYTPILVWLWVLVLAVQTFLFYRREKSVGTSLSPNIARIDIFWMLGLFFTGLAIGAFALKDVPNIMIPDEGAFWETARAIATGNLKPDFFAMGVYSFPVSSSIFQGWVMRLVGVNLWSWRFASVLAGTFTAIPLYLLAREWFDRRVAIMAALIMLTNPYYLSFARMGYVNSQALFPVVLSLYFWSLGYRRAAGLYYWLAGITAGLGFYTYPAAWLGLLTIMILMTLFLVIRRTKIRQAIFAIAIFLAATVTTAFPRLVYSVSNDNPESPFYKLVETSFISDFYGSTYYSLEELHPDDDSYLVGSNEVFYAPDIYKELLVRGTVRTLAALFDPFVVTERFMTTNFAGGFLAAIGLTLGLALSLRTIKQTRSILLLIWLAAGLFFLSIIAAFPPRQTYLVTIIPVLALLSAVGFVVSIDTLKNELSNKWTPELITRGQMWLFSFVTVSLAFFGVMGYFFVMPAHYPPPFEDTVSWIAWRNEESLTIYYVGADANKEHRVKYHVDTGMVHHTYINTTPAQFNWENVPFGSIVFYEEQRVEIPPPPLEFSSSATYTDQNGNVIGKAWTNTQVDLQPELPFFGESGKIPAPRILFYSVLVIFGLTVIFSRISVSLEQKSGKSAPLGESTPNNENIPPEKKIDSLGQLPDKIKLYIRQARQSVRSTQLWKKTLFAITMLISVIPVYFVVMDRWYERRIDILAVDDLWWSIVPLREVGYPRYFLIVFCAIILTVLSVLLWRKGPALTHPSKSLGKKVLPSVQVSEKQYRFGHYLIIGVLIITNISTGFMFLKGRIPGWELLLTIVLFISGQILMQYPIDRIRQYFRERRQFLIDAVIFVIALCSVLYNLFGESKPNLAFFLLFVFAAINFFRHKNRIPLTFWISVAALIALTWKINGWEYVVIGDEYSFFEEVRNILENRTAWELINTTFNGNFVYGTHPYFSSYIHYFFMTLFGNHNFGWRFSNPFLVASSVFFYYYFFNTFISRRTALITVIVLAFSHYLLSFSKIGYNNLQAFFALGLVLAAFAWALKTLNLAAFAMLGLSIGVCFYLYPAALYITPLPFLGMLLFYPPVNKDALKRWGLTIASILLLFYPLIAQPNYWGAKIAGTFFYTNVSNSTGALLNNISLNTVYTLLSFLYIPEQTHYVSTGYMDPISSIFIMIGFAYLVILLFRRNKSALFLALSFLWMFFIVGTTHGRNFPTATRMFLLLPWFALFAAFGLEWFAKKSAQLFTIKRKRLLSLVTILIVIANLYNAYIIDIRNMAQYHTLAPLFVKTVREIKANTELPPKSYAFVALPDWDSSGMSIIQRAYLIPESEKQLINLSLDGNQLPESSAELVKQRDLVVIVKANIDKNTLTQLSTQLRSWGKFMCEIRNGKGTLAFQLWHSGDLAWLCPQIK